MRQLGKAAAGVKRGRRGAGYEEDDDDEEVQAERLWNRRYQFNNLTENDSPYPEVRACSAERQ